MGGRGWMWEKRPPLRWRAPLLIGSLLMAVISAAGWQYKGAMNRLAREEPELLVTLAVATFVVVALLLLGLWLEQARVERLWIRRASVLAEGLSMGGESLIARVLRRMPDPLEWLLRPLWRTRLGRSLAEDWHDAELGPKASRYLLLLLCGAALGFLSGLRIGGVLLACALAFVIPLIPRAWVKNRAEARRARFGEQLPQALDSLASGLSAGLSFQQAVGFASDELPDPVAGAMASLEQRISLGVPTDRALGRLLEDHPEEALALVVDGIVLQRRFGGDLVAMLESTADLLRERVELEREVRAITSQGRLSGWVVAALVPVSAGILLLSNPVYINVLFQTLIGQALVALALALQLAGWVIISRMVQIRY